MRIGVPRVLSHYYLFPWYRTFLSELGVGFTETSASTPKDLENLKLCPTDEPCISVKTAFPHAVRLLSEKVDALFVPSVISLERDNYCCPKMMGLPAMLKAGLELNDSQMISPVIDLGEDPGVWTSTWVEAGQKMGVHKRVFVREALRKAFGAWRHAEKSMARYGLSLDALLKAKTNTVGFKQDPSTWESRESTALMGHAYLLNDSFGRPITKYLASLGGKVIFPEMIPRHHSQEHLRTVFEGEKMWTIEGHILGSCLYLIRNRIISRLILVTSFSCGPLSIIENFIMSEADKFGIPVLYLSIDEHTGQAGLITRLEAFMDSCQARRKGPGYDIHEEFCTDKAPSVPLPSGILKPQVGMVTLGHLDIALSALLKELEVNVVSPGALSDNMINAGKELAPEFICYPMVTLLGQMRALAEKGATHIIMIQGKGKCRLGWYAQVMENILGRAGYSVEVLAFDSPFPLKTNARRFFQGWKRIVGTPKLSRIIKAVAITLQKQVLLDKSLDILREIRAVEQIRGSGDERHQRFVNEFRENSLLIESKKAFGRYVRDMQRIPRISEEPLKVAVVGEIYVVNEPVVNKEAEKMLASFEQRVRVYRKLDVTGWVNCRVFKTPKALLDYGRVTKAAHGYLPVDVGGHGQESVGEAVLAGASGMDGVLHLFPFTCMPEIIAQSILVKVSNDLGIPILSLMISEQTGVAGLKTRLEAFCDLLEGRKKRSARTG